MILLLGATGQVGAATLASLPSGAPVRILARRPEALGAPAVAEVMAGSANSAADLACAMAGIGTVFLSTGDAGDAVGRETGVIAAAERAGVRRIVRISALTAELRPRVSFGVAHGAIDDRLRASPLTSVILRPSFFFQSLALFADPVRALGCLLLPVREGRIAFVDITDVAAAAARVLIDHSHDGGVLTLTGSHAYNMDEVSAALSRRLGRKVLHINPPLPVFRLMLRTAGGMSPELAGKVGSLMLACKRNAEADVRPDLERLLGRAPLGLEAYLDKAIMAFR